MTFFFRTAAALALAAAGAAAVPAIAQSGDGQDRRVVVENRTGQTIAYLRGSPTSDSEFGPDRIPNQVLGNGHNVIVTFDDGSRHCMYDLRATLANGQHIDRMNVNVCQISRWTIGRNQNSVR